MEAEQIYQVVNKLTGTIYPVADASIDKDRKENIEKFIDVFRKMHRDMDYIATRFADSPYGSQKEIGMLAEKCLDDMGIPKE